MATLLNNLKSRQDYIFEENNKRGLLSKKQRSEILRTTARLGQTARFAKGIANRSVETIGIIKGDKISVNKSTLDYLTMLPIRTYYKTRMRLRPTIIDPNKSRMQARVRTALKGKSLSPKSKQIMVNSSRKSIIKSFEGMQNIKNRISELKKVSEYSKKVKLTEQEKNASRIRASRYKEEFNSKIKGMMNNANQTKKEYEKTIKGLSQLTPSEKKKFLEFEYDYSTKLQNKQAIAQNIHNQRLLNKHLSTLALSKKEVKELKETLKPLGLQNAKNMGTKLHLLKLRLKNVPGGRNIYSEIYKKLK